MPVLVKFSGDYSDEFDCEEFAVMKDRDSYEKWLEQFKLTIDKGEVEFPFGTNECLIFESIDDLDQCLEVYDVTNEESAVLNRYFSRDVGRRYATHFGTSGIFDHHAWQSA